MESKTHFFLSFLIDDKANYVSPQERVNLYETDPDDELTSWDDDPNGFETIEDAIEDLFPFEGVEMSVRVFARDDTDVWFIGDIIDFDIEADKKEILEWLNDADSYSDDFSTW